VAELAFFRSVADATRGRFVIFPKVNLADILFSPTNSITDKNHIDRKHVDYLVADASTLRPVLGLELDDSSHRERKAAERDAVKDAAFKSAGLPLLRLANRDYASAEIVAAIDRALGPADTLKSPAPPVATEITDAQTCTNCGGKMVLRPGVPGRYEAFYGCSNYPRCHRTMPMPK
jgi:hypothetical protein